MQFTNPIWLLGISGILIPLAIHLLSRKEGKVIRVGSIRHFEETSTRQFKSLKLNEIVLLILRSLLILFIVLFLAGLLWPGLSNGDKQWLLVEKGLEQDTDLNVLIDSLEKNGFEKRAFAKDFPLYDDSISIAPTDYWALIGDLKKQSLREAVILTANRASAFRGERTALPQNVKWINKTLPSRKAIVSQIQSGDSVWTRTGTFSGMASEFETILTSHPTSQATPATTRVISVVTDKKYSYDASLVVASLKAIDDYVPSSITINQYDSDSFVDQTGTEWVVWMSDKVLVPTKASTILFKPNGSKNLLERKNKTTWIITQRLHPENVIKNNLTLSLAGILFPEREAAAEASKHDVRSADETLIASMNTGDDVRPVASTIDGVWIILITLTLIAERILSYTRMQ